MTPLAANPANGLSHILYVCRRKSDLNTRPFVKAGNKGLQLFYTVYNEGEQSPMIKGWSGGVSVWSAPGQVVPPRRAVGAGRRADRTAAPQGVREPVAPEVPLVAVRHGDLPAHFLEAWHG